MAWRGCSEAPRYPARGGGGMTADQTVAIVRRDCRPDAMTPARFRACLAAIGWGINATADILGLPHRLVARWSGGSVEIPAPVAAWLEVLAATHEAHPLPDGWTMGNKFTIGAR